MHEMMSNLVQPVPPLDSPARARLATALLGAALVVAMVELQRHWGSASTPLYLLIVAAIGAVGVGALWRQPWVVDNVGWLIDAIIFAQALGGLGLILAGADEAGSELLREMLFWSPLICVWWAIFYGHRVGLVVALAGAFYACLYLGGVLDGPQRHAHEYLVQAAGAIGLTTIAVGLFANSPATYCRTPAAFDAATHDPVTGITNRMTFEAEVAHVAAIADRSAATFSLIIVRLDGVAADGSDPALRAAAWRIAEAVRHSDSLCRWADASFMVMLPNTPRQKARQVGDGILGALAGLRAVDGREIGVKLGVCEYRIGEDPTAAIDQVERTI